MVCRRPANKVQLGSQHNTAKRATNSRAGSTKRWQLRAAAWRTRALAIVPARTAAIATHVSLASLRTAVSALLSGSSCWKDDSLRTVDSGSWLRGRKGGQLADCSHMAAVAE